MSKLMARGGLGVAFLLSSAGSLLGQSAMGAMDEAAERYREIHSLCSDFEQVMDVRLLRRRVESAGQLCQQRPNLFSMRFDNGDMVVSDGDSFWVYYPSLNADQVRRYPLENSPGGYDFFREFLHDPASKYAAADGGLEDVSGKTCRVVDLTPTKLAAYQSARVWLDPQTNLICRLEIHQDNGTIRTLTLRGLRINPALGADAFTFAVPDGARVVSPPS